VRFVDSGKDIKLKSSDLQAIHFTVVAWQQVMQSTTVKFFFVSVAVDVNITQKLTQTVLKKRMIHSMRTGLGLVL
jgi:hypothetical protein